MPSSQDQDAHGRGETEYTGLSSVPGQTPYEVFQEHAWKYAFAAQYVEGRAALDVGCAAGMGVDLFRRSGCRSVIGVDINPETLWFAPERYARGRSMLIQADATRMPIASETMDVVVALEIIEHVPDASGLLQQCVRVLRRNGVFICSVPNVLVTRNVNPFHAREYTVEELEATLRRLFAHIEIYQQCPVSRRRLVWNRTLAAATSAAKRTATATGLRRPLRALKRRIMPPGRRTHPATCIQPGELDPRYAITPYRAEAHAVPTYLLAVCRF